MKIATCNVNGIKSRLSNLLAWLNLSSRTLPACKSSRHPDAAFPSLAIAGAGYKFVAKGQRSWSGVAILARGMDIIPFRDMLPGDAAMTTAATLKRRSAASWLAAFIFPTGIRSQPETRLQAAVV